jgi:hypothetical protein
MSPSLSKLLKRPAGERSEFAMALWENLSNAKRGADLEADARATRGIGPALGRTCAATSVRDSMGRCAPQVMERE